jgi:hypothetical protein
MHTLKNSLQVRVVFLRWKEKFHLLGAGRELLKNFSIQFRPKAESREVIVLFVFAQNLACYSEMSFYRWKHLPKIAILKVLVRS